MASFLDIVLRGLGLVLVSLAAGGVGWLKVVLRSEPYAKPDRAAARTLRAVVWSATGAAAAQAAVLGVALADLALTAGEVPLGPFFETAFARVSLVRVALALAVGLLAGRLATRAAGPGPWWALTALAAALVASSAALSHAAARPGGRAFLLALDVAHQIAVVAWVGGLAHLLLYARNVGEPEPCDPLVARRFSHLAFLAVATLVATGLGLTVAYVGDPRGLIGTGYGVMVLVKVVLLLAMGGLALVNARLLHRRGVGVSAFRLARLVEVELGLAVTVLVAAASLTTLPPAVDVGADRATPREVAARFAPGPPRLASPSIDELLRDADPLMAATGARQPVERAWSEYNHHWAGVFVLAMGVLAVLERGGLAPARQWPLVLLGLAVFLFARSDPRAWPLGPAGFWESMTLPDVLQHRLFMLLIVALGVFEWMVRTGRLRPRPYGYLFPLLCAVGGGLLLAHAHAMVNLKQEFLTEVTHAPLGILGVFAGWARWLEVRLPGAGAGPGWVWRACFIGVGLLLLFYREG